MGFTACSNESLSLYSFYRTGEVQNQADRAKNRVIQYFKHKPGFFNEFCFLITMSLSSDKDRFSYQFIVISLRNTTEALFLHLMLSRRW